MKMKKSKVKLLKKVVFQPGKEGKERGKRGDVDELVDLLIV